MERQVICPSCGAATYRAADALATRDTLCHRCSERRLSNLTTKELRRLALDRSIFGALFMGRGGLLLRLSGRRLDVFRSLYLVPITLVWRLLVAVVLGITQVVLLPIKAARWLFTRGSKKGKAPAPYDEGEVTVQAEADENAVVHAAVERVTVRETTVREVVIEAAAVRHESAAPSSSED